jgi:uncharacterized repeat protein (TIGR02543 family)
MAVELMPTPTKTGYTFGGWYDGDNGTGNQVTDATIVTKHQIIYVRQMDTEHLFGDI